MQLFCYFSCRYYVFICTFAFCFCLWPYWCFTLYFPLKSVKILCVSLLVSVFFSICLPMVVGAYTLIEKSDCDKIVLALPVINIFTVKLLCYVNSFVLCQSFCFSVCHDLITTLGLHFTSLSGTWLKSELELGKIKIPGFIYI